MKGKKARGEKEFLRLVGTRACERGGLAHGHNNGVKSVRLAYGHNNGVAATAHQYTTTGGQAGNCSQD
mgnify:CR=1 FL=1